ncbi:MAG: hypothetical protein ABW139_10570 [Candidatus Thiodiazotropha sp. DIVDIV]
MKWEAESGAGYVRVVASHTDDLGYPEQFRSLPFVAPVTVTGIPNESVSTTGNFTSGP